MKTLKFLGAAVLSLLMFAGCKGGGSGAPATVADFCTQYADAVCQVTSTTCVGISMANCATYQESVCTTLANQAMADGKRIFAPGNVGDCINKVKAAFGSTAPITPTTQASIDLACNYFFQGKGVQLTDSCTTQFDCAGTTNGTIVCDAAQKLCATSMTVQGTKQCGEVGDVCATNFYCATSAANVSICTAEGTSGAASDCTTAPCDSNSRCASGTCMPLVAAGGSCTADSDCASAGYCDRFGSSPACDKGLSFANSSPSCLCVGQGMSCPAGLPETWGVTAGTAAGTGGTPGTGGAGGAAGASGGAAGHGAAGAGGTGGVGGGAAGGPAGGAAGAA
jgi:hypothetical protein